MNYRPDIDGLRAIAIIFVILYHSNILLTGGYIGVDIFFVISGFLITNIIRREIDSGKFDLAAFWARRIRRIAPAALVTILTTLVIGYCCLLPSDYYDLAKSSAASVLSLSNFYFFRSSDYFATTSDTKPLLHMWSLSTEEQFYILFPIALFYVSKLRSVKTTFLLLLVAAFASLIASEIGTLLSPTATFYLLPTRSWEMLVGALLAYSPTPHYLAASRHIRSAIAAPALITLLYCAIHYNPQVRFPGLAALPICLSTAIIIWLNSDPQFWTCKLLSFRPLVGIGLISYSLYLIHWPILAFGRYWFEGEMHLWYSTTSIITSFILAYLSYIYIETPFKKLTHLSLRNLLSRYILVSSVIIALGVASRQITLMDLAISTASNNWLKSSAPHAEFETSLKQLKTNGPHLISSSMTPDSIYCLVIGDSHGMCIAPALRVLSSENTKYTFALITASNKVPLFDTRQPLRARFPYDEWEVYIKNYIKQEKITRVLLVGRWTNYINPDSNSRIESIPGEINLETVSNEPIKSFKRGLSATVSWMNDHGVAVFFLSQIPEQVGNPRIAFTKHLLQNSEVRQTHPSKNFSKYNRQLNTAIADLMSDDNLNFRLLPTTQFFTKNGNPLPIGDADGPFFADYHHLSPNGAIKILAPLLKNAFELN